MSIDWDRLIIQKLVEENSHSLVDSRTVMKYIVQSINDYVSGVMLQ